MVLKSQPQTMYCSYTICLLDSPMEDVYAQGFRGSAVSRHLLFLLKRVRVTFQQVLRMWQESLTHCSPWDRKESDTTEEQQKNGIRQSLFTFMHWRRKWQPTPVFLPGESQGRGSLVGCRSMGSHRVGYDWSDLAAAAAECAHEGSVEDQHGN